MSHVDLSDRALCSLDEVTSYAPGYANAPDDSTDDLLIRLINAESRSAHQTTGREFVAIAAGSVTRAFDVGGHAAATRRLRIGDAATVTAVVIKDQTGATLSTVAAADRVSLGEAGNRTREEWEPICVLWLPPASPNPPGLRCGDVVEVTGTWGFPLVPDDVREAVAKLVIVRYLADAAVSGTAFSDALAGSEIDPAALRRSAFDVLRDYANPPFA